MASYTDKTILTGDDIVNHSGSTDLGSSEQAGQAVADINPVGVSHLLKLPNELLSLIAEACADLKRTIHDDPRMRKGAVSFSVVNKRIRVASIAAVFRSMRHTMSEQRFSKELRLFEERDDVLISVRSFAITVISVNSKDDTDLPRRMARVIKKMRFLQRLHVSFLLSKSLIVSFGHELKSMCLMAPFIRVFQCGSPGVPLDDIPKFFPKLECLSFNHNKTPISFAGLEECVKHLNLRTIALRKNPWTSNDIQKLMDLLGGSATLQTLHLEGYLGGVKVSDLVPKFENLDRLENLIMTAEQELQMDREQERVIQFERLTLMAQVHVFNEDLDDNALAFFQQVPSLNSVRLVRRWEKAQFHPARDETGEVTALYQIAVDQGTDIFLEPLCDTSHSSFF